ncbi:MAG: serine/threonine protein kinase, partial [Myxococcota bacterium]
MPNVSGESPLNPSRPAVLPRTFGRYELRAVTSANRWGVIFEAADPEAGGEPRAVGVLDPLLMNVPGLAPLFVSTAQHATGRVHPSLVRVYEAGFERNLAYVVSEWLQGWDLHGVLRRCRSSGRPLPARHALTLGTWAAEALAALHAPEPDLPNGAIHGRLAADKLFVREDGRFKLIGIGLPEVGQELWPLPDDVDHYALLAPEQLGDGVADHRADVYTLCVLVTTMCTGQNPFQRASIAKTAAAITSGDMKPCTTDRRMAPDLEMLLRRGMFVDPSQRPSSVAEIAEGLRPILASLGGPVEPEEWATFLKALFHSDGHRPEGIREIEIQERASRVMTAMDRWSPASMPQFDASRIMTPSAPSPLPPDEATEETPAAATRTPVSIEGPAPHLPAPPPKAAAPSRRAPVLVGL